MSQRRLSQQRTRITALLAAVGVLLIAATAVAVEAPARSSGPPSDSSRAAQHLREIELTRLRALSTRTSQSQARSTLTISSS